MRIKSLHTDFIMPTKGTIEAGAYDIYMPMSGCATSLEPIVVNLGFAAEVPEGYVSLILPRSGVGINYGLELNNTCGVIDSDYRGEWKACLRVKTTAPLRWNAGDRLLQFLLLPVLTAKLELVDELSDTSRGKGSFGSSGQ